MDSLKFLGKPGTEYICCCGNGEYCNERAGDKDCPCEARIESLEGAIKEIIELVHGWRETNKLLGLVPKRDHLEHFEELLKETIGERT